MSTDRREDIDPDTLPDPDGANGVEPIPAGPWFPHIDGNGTLTHRDAATGATEWTRAELAAKARSNSSVRAVAALEAEIREATRAEVLAEAAAHLDAYLHRMRGVGQLTSRQLQTLADEIRNLGKE